MKRQIRVRVRGAWHTVEVEEPVTYPIHVTVDGESIEVEVESQTLPLGMGAPRPAAPRQAAPVGLGGISHEDEKLIRSPMPGRIVSVSVVVWAEMKAGDSVCVLETMKMEQSILISHSGTVRAVFVREGQNVAAGDPLIQLE